MPEFTDEDYKVVKERSKAVVDFFKSNDDVLLAYPEVLADTEGAIADAHRKMELRPGQFEASKG